MIGENSNEEDPDVLRPFPAIGLLDEWIDIAQREVSDKEWVRFGRNTYPGLIILQIQLRVHAVDFSEALDEYDLREKMIDRKYMGDPITKGFKLYHQEAEDRLKSVMILWNEIGPGRIDERYAYSQIRSPDFIDFSSWKDE